MTVCLSEPITVSDSGEVISAVTLTPSIFQKLLNLSRGMYYIIFIPFIMYKLSFIFIICVVYKQYKYLCNILLTIDCSCYITYSHFRYNRNTIWCITTTSTLINKTECNPEHHLWCKWGIFTELIIPQIQQPCKYSKRSL